MALDTGAASEVSFLSLAMILVAEEIDFGFAVDLLLFVRLFAQCGT